MPIFSGKIIRSRFTNELNDTIEILFEHNGQAHPYYIAVDPTHPNFKALEAEGWDIERIQKETVEFNRAQSRAYNQLIDSQLENHKKDLRKEFEKELNRRIGEFREAEVVKSQLFKTVIDSNEDEEIIFKIKLAIFDLPKMKALKDREGKMRLRKAKTVIKTLAIFEELMENNNESSGSIQSNSPKV